MSVLGTITLSKIVTDDGACVFRADYDSLTIYESIGVLQAELDYQRAVLQDARFRAGDDE